MSTPVSDPASLPKPAGKVTWCHQHLAWECPFIWGADDPNPSTPKFCCHQPHDVPHNHDDPPSLPIPAGKLTGRQIIEAMDRFKDTAHTEALERIRHLSDAASLAMSADEVGPWWCRTCGRRWAVVNAGGTGVCSCGNQNCFVRGHTDDGHGAGVVLDLEHCSLCRDAVARTAPGDVVKAWPNGDEHVGCPKDSDGNCLP